MVLLDLVPPGVPVGLAAFRAEAQQTGLRVMQRPVAAAARDAHSKPPLNRIVGEG